MAGMSWQNLAVMAGMMFAAAGFAIQLGSTQTHVQINGDRLTILEVEQKQVERSLAKMIASQAEQDRRLLAIEQHDLETRATESKMLERISKLEAK